MNIYRRSLYCQLVWERAGQHMEMSLLQALFLSNMVGGLELVCGNKWEYHVAQKASTYKSGKRRLPLKIFFFSIMR